VWRSPATVCLNDYLKHLAVFSQEVSRGLCWQLALLAPACKGCGWLAGGLAGGCHDALTHRSLSGLLASPSLWLQAVVELTEDWPASFQHLRQAVVNAQVGPHPLLLLLLPLRSPLLLML
jgi:hypothetical protein